MRENGCGHSLLSLSLANHITPTYYFSICAAFHCLALKYSGTLDTLGTAENVLISEVSSFHGVVLFITLSSWTL